MIYNETRYNMHWNTKRLNELGEFARGKSKHRPRNDPKLFEDGKYPLIQTGDVKAANFMITQHEQEYSGFGLKQSKLWDAGTLCITIAANIAETGILAYPMCFPDSVVGFNAYNTESSGAFMHYVFTFIRNSIQNSVNGSIQDNINIDYLSGLSFKVPVKSYQDKIVHILALFDQKIELNNSTVTELETTATAIFDYWFKQFEFPDIEGKPYRTSGGEMVWDEQINQEIPRGWNVMLLDKLGSFKNGINYNKDVIGDKTYSIVNVRNISASKLVLLKQDMDKIKLPSTDAAKYLVPENSILIARSGIPGATRIFEGDISDIIYCGFIICYSLYDGSKRNYLAYKLKELENSAVNSASGTILKNVSQDTLKDIRIIVPSDTIIQKFNDLFVPINTKMTKCLEENIELKKLRDWLLTMLMNGQVKIKDCTN